MTPFVMHLPVAVSAASYIEVAQGLSARLAFSQERDATNWIDEGTFDNDGTLVNAPAWNAEGGPGDGLPGYFSFNGTDQRIDLGDSTPLRFAGTDRAFVWWMRHDGLAQTGESWEQVWGKGNFDYGMRHNHTSTTEFEIRADGTGGNAYVTIPANEWVMLVAQAEGTAFTVHRVTGTGVTLLGSGTVTAALVESASKFKFAAQDRTATAESTRRFWRGDLAGFLAFTNALTTAQMEELYAAAMADPPPASAEAQVFEPYYEWSFTTTDYSGDPYDVHALATFTRQGSADTYDVALFYAGSNTFKLRFTGPRTGTWDFTTASAHAGLNGLTGRISIIDNTDPNAKGFLSADGVEGTEQAFAYQTGDGTTKKRMLTNSYMRHNTATSPLGFETIGNLPSDATERGAIIEANLDIMQANGIDTWFTIGYHNWVAYPRLSSSSPSTSEYPDAFAFAMMEDLLQRLYNRGMFLHIWWGGNDQAQQSMRELVGGIGGTTDMRVRRYIAARLGAYPNWYMEPGYDLEEWWSQADAAAWHADMTAFNTLPRLYTSRESQAGLSDGFFFPTTDKQDFYSQDNRPTSGFHADAITRHNETNPNVPTVYTRRFLHTRDAVWDMLTTRRAIWQFTLAGYAGGIYGTLWGAGADYPNPEWLATIGTFWRDRIATRMNVHYFIDGVAVDGFAVANSDASVQVVYKENTGSITIRIPTGMTNVPVVAVNAAAAYAETSMGTYSAGTHTVTLPSTSDWALAVGVFSGVVEAFPPVEGRTSGATSSLTEDPSLDLSALPLTEGHVLLLAFRSNSVTHTGPSGWTKRGEQQATGSDDKLTIWTKVVGSSEPSSQSFIQSGADRCGWTCIEVSGVATGEAAWVAAELAEGFDPPNLTIPWGSAKQRLVTTCSVGASANTLTAPSGYTNQVDGASDSSTSSSRIRTATADREGEVGSENPAAWGESGTTFLPVTATIALRPA